MREKGRVRACVSCAVSTVWCCGQARGHACEAPPPIIPLLTHTKATASEYRYTTTTPDPTASRQLLRLCSHAPQQASLLSLAHAIKNLSPPPLPPRSSCLASLL